MSDSKIIWLALGLVVGYLVWGQKRVMVTGMPTSTTPAIAGESLALPLSLPWSSGGCGCGGHA